MLTKDQEPSMGQLYGDYNVCYGWWELKVLLITMINHIKFYYDRKNSYFYLSYFIRYRKYYFSIKYFLIYERLYLINMIILLLILMRCLECGWDYEGLKVRDDKHWHVWIIEMV